MIFFHLVNLGMYLAAGLLYSLMFFGVHKCECMYVVKSAIKITSLFAMLLCSLFIYLQLEWILTEKNAVVGDKTALLWLVYDYVMAIFLLSVVASIKIYCNWVDMRNHWAKRRGASRSNENEGAK